MREIPTVVAPLLGRLGAAVPLRGMGRPHLEIRVRWVVGNEGVLTWYTHLGPAAVPASLLASSPVTVPVYTLSISVLWTQHSQDFGSHCTIHIY